MTMPSAATPAEDTFLFTSESVGEGHPGIYIGFSNLAKANFV
jgi:hypothetical protein